MQFNENETATILAALRFWQGFREVSDVPEPQADHFTDAEELTAEQIDDLCERINCDSEPLTVVTVEGGLVSNVFHLIDGDSKDVEFSVIDWDVAEEDTQVFVDNLIPDVKDYIEKNLPDDWATVQERLK